MRNSYGVGCYMPTERELEFAMSCAELDINVDFEAPGEYTWEEGNIKGRGALCPVKGYFNEADKVQQKPDSTIIECYKFAHSRSLNL